MRRWQLTNKTSLLVLIMLLGVVGHNRLVSLAAGSLLTLDLLGLGVAYAWIRKSGPTTGFVFLVSALLTSFVQKDAALRGLVQLLDWQVLFVTLAAGVAASVLCKQGMDLLTVKPGLIVGLVVGSLVGVLVLHGVPVGPFVAAGMVGMVLRLVHD